MMNMLLIVGALIILGISSIPGANEIHEIYDVPIILIDGDIIYGRYHLVSDLHGYCTDITDRTGGCANPISGEMYILYSQRYYVDPYYPIDIFTHEYLHVRCEHDSPGSNWHVGNGGNQIILKGIDYWNTCGGLR